MSLLKNRPIRGTCNGMGFIAALVWVLALGTGSGWLLLVSIILIGIAVYGGH